MSIVAFAIAATARAEGPPSPPAEERPIVYKLHNGLTVRLSPVPRRRFAAVAIAFPVGTASVPRGWTGLAHLAEHLLFQTPDTLGAPNVRALLEAASSIDFNAATGMDWTFYYEVMPSDRLEHAIRLEAHRFGRILPGLTEEKVAHERDIVLHEGWEQGHHLGEGLLAQQRYAGVFGKSHPYARFIERRSDVRAIGMRELTWFFHEHYHLDRAVLAVVGGFDPAQVRAAIQRHFGGLRSSPSAPVSTEPPVVTPMPGERRIEVALYQPHDSVTLNWRTPPVYAAGDAALDLVVTLLNARRSALREALIGSGIASAWSVHHSSQPLGSLWTIRAVPASGHSVEECIAAIDQVLATLRRHPFSEPQVAWARQRVIRGYRIRGEDLRARAIHMAATDSPRYLTFEAERRRYTRLTRRDVIAAVRRWLPPRRRLVLVGRARQHVAEGGRVLSDRGWSE